ncbi:peptide chain release factor N(5)-glutamine methyltransferase [Aerococcus mictus]|nr:peptide chain release factor N(5)-glutamine methyltransferase [Aerococcus mictus]
MKRPSNQLRFIEAQQWASSFLESNSKDPAIAYHLLLGMMDWDVTTWYRKQQDQMDLVIMKDYQEMVKKIVDEDMPYQYLLGEAWFYGYRFRVNEATLIPRFDTERLIDCVHSLRETRQLVKQADVLDLGTGSGAIAVTLAKEFPDLNLTAVDISSDALAVAKENAHFHQVTIEWIQGNMLNAVPQRKFDLIISNPPYISENEIDEMGADVLKYEPKLALFAKDDGYYY